MYFYQCSLACNLSRRKPANKFKKGSLNSGKRQQLILWISRELSIWRKSFKSKNESHWSQKIAKQFFPRLFFLDMRLVCLDFFPFFCTISLSLSNFFILTIMSVSSPLHVYPYSSVYLSTVTPSFYPLSVGLSVCVFFFLSSIFVS